MLTLINFRIFIQTLRHTVEPYTIPLIVVPDKPGLDFMRKTLAESPLGEDERDIFFPSWTKTIHVLHLDDHPTDYVPTWEEVETKRQLIENDEQLAKTLDKEANKQGSVSIILQKCRSKRYTRKAVPATDTYAKATDPPSSPTCIQNTPGSPARNGNPRYGFTPPYTPMYAPQEGYVPVDPMYYEQVQQYGMMPPAVFSPPPYFVHYGVGCVPYGYVAPSFVQPFVHTPAYYGYNSVM